MHTNDHPSYYDLIVVGLGLVGSSTLYQAAKLLNKNNTSYLEANGFLNKPRVLGIEQYDLCHTEGSSHGESRITRLAIGEGSHYVPLAMRSQALLKEIQNQLNTQFDPVCYEKDTGVLIIGSVQSGEYFHDKKGFLQNTQAIADEYHIPHVNYTSKDALDKAFPTFNFKSNEAGYHEQTMGIMAPDALIKAQIHLAKKQNAEVNTNEQLLDFKKLPNGKIFVKTSKREYLTNKLILTTGPWLGDLLRRELAEELKVYRQTVFYFEVNPHYLKDYQLGNFPPFIWHKGNNQCLYGFPIMQEGKNTIKIATETFSHPTKPDLVERTVTEQEKKEMYDNFIKPNLKGILPHCSEAFVCLYTKTPHSQFLIDYLPSFGKNVMFASACSGHGAKHSLAVGEALAQQSILGRDEANILQFNLTNRHQEDGFSLTPNLNR